MGLRISKRKSIGHGRTVGVSRGGVTVGQRKGRASVSTRGISFRILPGVSIRLPF